MAINIITIISVVLVAIAFVGEMVTIYRSKMDISDVFNEIGVSVALFAVSVAMAVLIIYR